MITAQNLLGRWERMASRAAGRRLSSAADAVAPASREGDAVRQSPIVPRGASAVLGSRLERRDLVVDLRAVIKVILVPAGSREEELDAVAAHAVVAGAGAGVRIRSGASPARIARAVREVLGDSAYRAAAARAASTIAAEKRRDAAVDALEELADASRSDGARSGARAAVPGSAS
jgi:hypothetical protein